MSDDEKKKKNMNRTNDKKNERKKKWWSRPRRVANYVYTRIIAYISVYTNTYIVNAFACQRQDHNTDKRMYI